MRKVSAATALCAIAIAAVGAAAGAAAQGPIKAHGKVAVFAAPVNTVDSKGKTKTTSVTVTAVQSIRDCTAPPRCRSRRISSSCGRKATQ